MKNLTKLKCRECGFELYVLSKDIFQSEQYIHAKKEAIKNHKQNFILTCPNCDGYLKIKKMKK